MNFLDFFYLYLAESRCFYFMHASPDYRPSFGLSVCERLSSSIGASDALIFSLIMLSKTSVLFTGMSFGALIPSFTWLPRTSRIETVM
jgi:hypothetical protein